jgi:hypothetical protein
VSVAVVGKNFKLFLVFEGLKFLSLGLCSN